MIVPSSSCASSNPWLNQQTGVETCLLVSGWTKVIVREDCSQRPVDV